MALLTRRQLLALFATAPFVNLSQAKATALSADVIIVGAGAAGLNTARLLKARGKRVLVLEASNRIGGRVFSHRLASGHSIELGAQWLGTRGQTRLLALVRAQALALTGNYAEGKTVYRSAGKNQLLSDGEVPLTFAGKLDAYRVSNEIQKAAKALSLESPWLTGASLDLISAKDWLAKLCRVDSCRAYWQNLAEQGACADLAKVSALELLHNFATIGSIADFDEADGFYFSEGMQSVFETVARELGASLLLNQAVQKIVQDSNGVTVETGQGKFTAARVVLALPPQIYRGIRCEPSLPKTADDIQVNWQRGMAVKAIGVFDKPWWREMNLSGKIDSPDEVFDYIVDTSPANAHCGVLVGLIAGPRAEAVSKLGSPQLAAKFLDHVEQSFGTKTTLKAFFHHNWVADPLTLGAYSSRRGLGEWTRTHDVLTQPIGRIHFAGTETARAWRGYVEGALESAERVASEISQF